MTVRAYLLIFVATVLATNPCRSAQATPSPDATLAIWAGNIEVLKEIIKKNPDWVNQYRFGLDPPIVEAARHGKGDIIELLVANGANVNAHGTWGKTALHFTANEGNAQLVDLLLKHNASVNSVDENGFTPIIQSIRNVEVLKLLLAYGADINAHGGNNTLYSQAIGNPRSVGAGVIDFILANGVDVTASGEEGLLQVVLFNNDTNLVKKIVPYYAESTNPGARVLLQSALETALNREHTEMASAIVSACFEFQSNSLHRAVASRDDSTVRSMLSSNAAPVNAKDFLGWTPLHLAAIQGKTQLANLLISNQANVNSRDEIGNTPLHWSVFFGHGDIVDQLLQHEAMMDVPGNGEYNNDTALDLAIQQGFTSIATKLIVSGASLDSHKWWNDTPLHIATDKENVELVKLLVSRGANVNACRGGNYKQTPLDIAVTGNSPECVQLFLAKGASLRTLMQTQSGKETTLFHLWAGGSGNLNTADQLLATGCDINATNGEGQTPLHIAVGKWAVAYKADLNRTNSGPQNPPIMRLEESGGEAARWLLSHKANVNTKDNDGHAALHVSVTRGSLKAIEALVDAGADVNATDTNGKTALALLEDLKIGGRSRLYSGSINFKAIEKLLQDHGAKGPILSPEAYDGFR